MDTTTTDTPTPDTTAMQPPTSAVVTNVDTSVGNTTTTTDPPADTSSDNIPYDQTSVLAEIEKMTIEATAVSEEVPPLVFARQPTAADSYINLVNAWREAETAEVINITPTSISEVGRSIGINQHSFTDVEIGKTYHGARNSFPNSGNGHSAHNTHTTQRVTTSMRRDVMYESDDDSGDEPLQRDVEEKIDATYNKLCGLVTLDSELIEEMHQFNGRIENLNRVCANTEKLTNSHAIILTQLNSRMEKLESEMQDIKMLITSLVRTKQME